MSAKQVFHAQQATCAEANNHPQSGYAPEQVIVRLLGSVVLPNGKHINIYATVSKQHVLIRPVDVHGNELSIGTPTKITDLGASLRRRLGC